MSLFVIAEGVETEEQRDLLAHLGCAVEAVPALDGQQSRESSVNLILKPVPLLFRRFFPFAQLRHGRC
jgi:hypothetical protein